MRSRVISVIVAIGSTACATPRAESASARDPVRASVESTNARSYSGEPGHDSTGSSAPERGNSTVSHASHEPAAPGDAVELSDFCSEHGVAANLNVERCVSTPLGARPDAQLWCSRREELDDNRVLYLVALYRVQGKGLVKVIELPYAVGPKPLEARPDDVTYYVKLFPDVTADVKSFEIREESGFSCDDAIKGVRDEFSPNPEIERSIEQSITRVCSNRGKYAANGRRQK